MNGTGHPSYPRRRYPLPILALVLALVLTLSWAVVSYAGRAGGWKATEFQVQNMDNETANFTAHFGPTAVRRSRSPTTSRRGARSTTDQRPTWACRWTLPVP